MAASSAVTVVVVARLLGPSGAGTVAFGVWVASITAQIALMGLPQVALRFLASKDDCAGVAQWISRRTALLSVPAMVLAAVASSRSGETAPVALATSLLSVAAMLSTVAQAVLAGQQHFRRLAMLSGWSALLQVAAAAAGSLLAGGTGALIGHVVGQAPLVYGLRLERGAHAPAAREVLLRARSFALHTWIAILASLAVWSRLEYAFLQVQGADAVAMYSVALTITQLGIQPTTLLSSALLPHFGALVAGRRHAAATDTYAAVTRVLGCIAFPLCFSLAALAPPLVATLFGTKFSGAVAAAAILAASGAVVAIAPGASALTYAHDRTRFNAVLATVAGVVAVPLFAIVIPRFGVVGAAVARSFVQSLTALSVLAYVALRLGGDIPARSLTRSAMAGAGSALCAGAVASAIGPGWLGLCLGGAAALGGFAVLATRLRLLEPSDARQLEPLVAMIPPCVQRPARAFLRSVAGVHP